MVYIAGLNRGQVTVSSKIIDEYISYNNFIRALGGFIENLDLKKVAFIKSAPLK